MKKQMKKYLLSIIMCVFILQYAIPVQADEKTDDKDVIHVSHETALEDCRNVDEEILNDFENEEIMWICKEDNVTVVANDVEPNDVQSMQEQILEDFTDEEILGVYTEGNITIVACKVPSNLPQPRVTSKSISVEYSTYIDGIYSFRIRHDITFAYGIPADGHIAQIMSGTAKVIDVNGASAYYPDTSAIITSSTNGNPAVFTSGTNMYIRFSNQYFKSVAIQTFCYGSGKYE